MVCWRIQVKGVVQGVGFRPFVWQQATALGLRGRVWNDGQGVVIEACGTEEKLQALIKALQQKAPPLAQVDAVSWQPMARLTVDDFRIVASASGAMTTRVPADAATCSACLAEVFDPDNRRYGYAFTNCTHCGPRYSIITAMPYDRAHTSMAPFTMCPVCQAEYDDPRDRRFHAQPNACPVCGPHLMYYRWHEGRWMGERVDNLFPLVAEIAASLQRGAIWAIKGLGGFHLLCSAHDEAAVARLRQLKRRPHKPFALMATLEMVHQYVHIPQIGQKWLENPASPIVLLRQKSAAEKKPGDPLAALVAPGQAQLGFMLPHTPLHHALLQAFAGVVVMTSCNGSGQPQLYEDEAVLKTFGPELAGIVGHNRPIVRRLEDSVVRICPLSGEQAQVLRLARGLAPLHGNWPSDHRARPLSATGADLKGAIALARTEDWVLSQYLGDLENLAAHGAYEQAWRDLHQLYAHRPDSIVCDLHPGYFSHAFAQQQGKPVCEQQHHCAHVGAVIVEHGLSVKDTYLGLVLDGLGYGEAGGLWGGELLRWRKGACQRLRHALPFRLLGGARAQREPWRVLLALLWQSMGADWQQVDAEVVTRLQHKPLKLLYQAWAQGLNAPQSTSVARWFDALAALTGLWLETMSFEGQAAMLTEAAVQTVDWRTVEPAPFAITDEGLLDARPVWPDLLQRLAQGEQATALCARFYLGLAQTLVHWVDQSVDETVAGVVLGGGVMQNLTLIELIRRHWPDHLPPLYWPEQVPANDQGIAVGQLLGCDKSG